MEVMEVRQDNPKVLFKCFFQQDSRAKPEPSPEEEEDVDEGEEEGDERRSSPASRRSEEGGIQQTSSPGSQHSSPHGEKIKPDVKFESQNVSPVDGLL